jgi:hypothetical protein
MITPTLNINGSSLTDLIQPRLAAIAALHAAIKALQQVTPNGRDYPGDNDQCVADRDEHYARLKTLDAIAAGISGEGFAINEQIK